MQGAYLSLEAEATHPHLVFAEKSFDLERGVVLCQQGIGQTKTKLHTINSAGRQN